MSEQETGWPAQRMGMPVGWYADVANGSGAEFPVSGDRTTRAGAAARFARKVGFGLTSWQEQVLGQWMDHKGHADDAQPPEDA